MILEIHLARTQYRKDRRGIRRAYDAAQQQPLQRLQSEHIYSKQAHKARSQKAAQTRKHQRSAEHGSGRAYIRTQPAVVHYQYQRRSTYIACQRIVIKGYLQQTVCPEEHS